MHFVLVIRFMHGAIELTNALDEKCGLQIAQSVERLTLEVEILGSKPALGTWWWGWIPPKQTYPKGAAPAATTILPEW